MPGQPGQEIRCGQGVTGAQAGECPRLGEAAQHQQSRQPVAGQARRFAGHGVHERLVHHEHPTRPRQRAHGVRRMQHGRRVGRVAQHHEIGLGRDLAGTQGVAVVGTQHHTVDRDAGVGQRDLGFGERRVHDGGQRRPERGQQREALRGTRQHEHVGRGAAVPRGDAGAGGGVQLGGGIAAQAGQFGGELGEQPVRRPVPRDVDGEIGQTGRGIHVAVVAQAGALVGEVAGHRAESSGPARVVIAYAPMRVIGCA